MEELYKYTTVKQHEQHMRYAARQKQIEDSNNVRASQMVAYNEKLENLDFAYLAYGTFVWLIYAPLEKLDFGLTGMDIVRLIYLSTYLDYYNVLRINNKTEMKLKDFPKILDVSERSAKLFITAIKKAGLLIEKDGKLKLNQDVVYRGTLKFQANNIRTIRIYIDTVRELYLNTSKKERNKLLYIFKLIPFVNIKYNIVCNNIDEENIDNVQILTLEELCNVLNYDKAHIARLRCDLAGIRLNGKHVIAFLTVNNYKTSTICVSPALYHAGERNDVIDMLLNVFRTQDGK